MPDNNYPRFPASQGRDVGQHAAARPVEDPLAELARIVSERAPDPAPPPPPSARETARRDDTPENESRSHPVAQPAAPGPQGRPDPLGPGLIDDLEAELLSNLQASFSAVEESASRRPPPPRPAPVVKASGEQPEPPDPVMALPPEPVPEPSSAPEDMAPPVPEHAPPPPEQASPAPEHIPPAPEDIAPPAELDLPAWPEPDEEMAAPPAVAQPAPPPAPPARAPARPPIEALDAPAVLRQRIRGFAAEAASARERPPSAPGPLPDADPFAGVPDEPPPMRKSPAAPPASVAQQTSADSDAPAPRWPPRMDDLTDEWLNDISGLRPAARTADANGKAAPPQAEQAQAATAAPVSGPVENAAFANGPAANAPNGVFPARKAPPRAPESVRPPPAEARSPEASVAPAHPGVAEQVRPRTDADDWNLDDGGFVGKRVDISSLPLRRGRQPDELPAGQPEPGAAPHIAPSNVAPPNISPPQVAGPPALASPEDRKAEVPSLAPQPLPQPPQTRWDAPAEQESRFAPRGRHGRAHAAEPRSRMPETGDAQSPPVAAAPEAYFGEEDHPQESLPPRSRLAGLLGRTGTRAPEPGLDDDMFPADDDLMPFETDDLKGLIGRRRPPIGLLAGGLLLAVVAIGGGAALFLMNSGGGTGGPIIVAAESGPFKITPEPIEAGAGEPNKLIYDRVDGSSDGGQEVVVLQPGAEVPVDRSVDPADSPIARVILPDPISGGGPPSGEGLLAQEPPAEAPDLGPRRVRTVVVRPDGTIVSNTTEGASDSGGSALVVEPEPPVANDDTLAIAGSGAGGNGELAITPDPPPAVATPSPPQQALALAPEPVTPQPAAPQPVAPAPAQRAAPAPVQPPAQAAGPIDLSPSGGTTQSASQAASGGMLVQISSQRSEDAALATFRDLKARYPRILGPFNVDIQRADLGARGIYFRVRVGPFSANDAQRLCDDLKAAGGDCILSRS